MKLNMSQKFLQVIASCFLNEDTRVTYMMAFLLTHILQTLHSEQSSFYFTQNQPTNSKHFPALYFFQIISLFFPIFEHVKCFMWGKISISNSFGENEVFGTHRSMLNKTLFQTLFYIFTNLSNTYNVSYCQHR
jgi:hypothetical protein